MEPPGDVVQPIWLLILRVEPGRLQGRSFVLVSAVDPFPSAAPLYELEPNPVLSPALQRGQDGIHAVAGIERLPSEWQKNVPDGWRLSGQRGRYPLSHCA